MPSFESDNIINTRNLRPLQDQLHNILSQRPTQTTQSTQCDDNPGLVDSPSATGITPGEITAQQYQLGIPPLNQTSRTGTPEQRNELDNTVRALDF